MSDTPNSLIDSTVHLIDSPRWRVSSRSGNGGDTCVEVADNLPGRVLVRDSKDRSGPVLEFGPDGWAAFVASVPTRAGR